MKFRTITHCLTLIALIAAFATTAAAASAAAVPGAPPPKPADPPKRLPSVDPPAGGVGNQDLSTPGTPGDPHNPGGTGGDNQSTAPACGPDVPQPCVDVPTVNVSLHDQCKNAAPNTPECSLYDQVMDAARHGQQVCADLPGLGHKCIGPADVGAPPPPPPGPCETGDAQGCAFVTGCPPVIRDICVAQVEAGVLKQPDPPPAPGPCETGDAQGCAFVTGCPPVIRAACEAQVQAGLFKGQDQPPTPPAAVDCAQTPQDASCDPGGHWCYDHPEDPDCAGVTGTYCDEHPDAAECNADQAPGLADATNGADNADNATDGADNGLADNGGVDVVDDGGGTADGGQ